MADQNQVKTLSVRQIMDSSDYARGAREFVAANREMSQSSAVIGTIVTQTQVKISNAADGVTRLVRAYDPAAAAAVKFQSEIVNLNRSLETGKVSAEEAARIYAGMVQKFSMAADGADIMAQGFSRLGAVISTTNAEMTAFAQASQAIEMANQELREATVETERLSRAASVLRAQIDPVGTAQARLNAELADYSAMLNRGIISTNEFAKAEALARTRHDEFVNSLNRTPANDNVSEAGAQFRKQNLGQQLLDVGQTAALGAPLGMIALQQGPQIAGIYAGQGGAKALLADLGGIAKIVGPVALGLAGLYGVYKILQANSAEAALSVSAVTRALAEQAMSAGSLESAVGELAQIQKTYSDALLSTASAQDAATKSILANSEREFNAKKSLLEVELKRQEAARALQDSLIAIEGLQLKQEIGSQMGPRPDVVAKGFADPKINGGIPFVNLPDDISGMQKLNDIVANSPVPDKLKEMAANSTLADIAVEKLREGLKLAFNAGQALLDQGNGIGPGSSSFAQAKAYTDALLKIQEAEHAFYNPPNVPIERVPVPGIRPNNFLPPIDQDETKTLTAQEQLTEATKRRIAALQNEVDISGHNTATQARLRLEYEMLRDAEEAAVRDGKDRNDIDRAAIIAKADAIAKLNQAIAGQQFDQDQKDQLALLQHQAAMIGATVDQQNRANAVFQAELQMREQGLSLLGEEADRRRAVADAIGHATTEIARQQDAYRGLQQTEGSVIDDLIASTGSFQDRIRAAASDLLKYIAQLGANSVKNALTGSNLPTLADLFSGKPKVPGVGTTSTPMMTVTATTVMINGGLAGVPGAAGLGKLLGYQPANNNVPAPANSNDPFAALLGTAGRTRTGIPLSTISANGLTANVNSKYAANFQGFINELQARGYDINSLGGYNFRNIAGTNKLSNHAFGDAIDINPRQNPVTYPGRGQSIVTDLPADVQSMAARYGLQQGIWKSKYDPMHFEVAKGAQPMHLDQSSQNLTKFSNNLLASSKDVSKLGDTSLDVGKHLTDVLGTGGLLGKGAMPANKLPTNYFPPAPTQSGGFNPFSLFTSIFSLFGFADGTDFAPGGLARINERGAGGEIINLPRGSQVIPAHKADAALRRSGPQTVVHRYESNIVVSGNGDKELMDRVRVAADEISRGHLDQYRANTFNDDVERYNNAPYDRG